MLPPTLSLSQHSYLFVICLSELDFQTAYLKNAKRFAAKSQILDVLKYTTKEEFSKQSLYFQY